MIRVSSSAAGLDESIAVGNQLRNNWLGPGPKVDEFEREFCKFRGFYDFVMLSSGTAALQMAVHLLDLPEYSEVILPSFTWVSCAQAVALCGHKPIFCDV